MVGYAADAHTTAPLATLSSALLRFTPVASDRPTLVGSNLHLSMGATEIDNLRVSPSEIRIDLNDAGAQTGSLTFQSPRPLQSMDAVNCKVDAVEDLGASLWRVNLSGRQWGRPQSLSLRVVSP